MATCFVVFQAYERLVYIPLALVDAALLDRDRGIAACSKAAVSSAVSAIYLAGACVGLAIACGSCHRVVRPRLTTQTHMWRAS